MSTLTDQLMARMLSEYLKKVTESRTPATTGKTPSTPPPPPGTAPHRKVRGGPVPPDLVIGLEGARGPGRRRHRHRVAGARQRIGAQGPASPGEGGKVRAIIPFVRVKNNRYYY